MKKFYLLSTRVWRRTLQQKTSNPMNNKGQELYNFSNRNFSDCLGSDISEVVYNFQESRNDKTTYFLRNKLIRLYKFFRKNLDLQYGMRVVAFEDTISMSDLPHEFHKAFLANSHPYGITLSVDEIGSDCLINQHATLGANRTSRRFDEPSQGHKPRLGHFVAVYPGAVISGPVSIGHFSIIGANTIVSKDVPPFSFVTGVNEVSNITDIHMKTFLSILHHQLTVRKNVQRGLVYSSGQYYENFELSKFKKEFYEFYAEHNDFELDRFRECAQHIVKSCTS